MDAPTSPIPVRRGPTLGLRANAGQFALLVLVNELPRDGDDRGHVGFVPWLVAPVASDWGRALVQPTLLAAVADGSDPGWRASAIGTYRLWRDLGFGVGALAVGFVADRAGMTTTIALVGLLTAGAGLLTAGAGLVVLVRMRDARPHG